MEMEAYKEQIKNNIIALIEQEKMSEALALISEHESLFVDDVEMFSMVAVIAIKQGELSQAKEIIYEGLLIDKNNFDLNYNLGYIYEQLHDFEQAIEYYQIAQGNCLDNAGKQQLGEYIKKIATQYNISHNEEIILVEEPKNSEKLANNISELETDKQQIKNNIRDLIEQGQMSEALALISEYENLFMDDIEVFSMTAVIAIKQGLLSQAKEIIEEGLLLDKNNFDLNYKLAYLYEQSQHFKQAIDYYKIAQSNCVDDASKQEIEVHMKKIANKQVNIITTNKNKDKRRKTKKNGRK